MTVLALAGRRVDAADAPNPALPLANIALVRDRLAALMDEERVERLVCSAANGSDLIGLGLAMARGVVFTIVLPFAPAIFRRRSVDDRPGSWGDIFERATGAAKARGSLIVVNAAQGDENAYAAANATIIKAAETAGGTVLAAVAWEGHARGEHDHTAAFLDAAIARGHRTRSILTIG
ncbi:hypothetical protein [Sphingomonas sp. CARO-RG-8B-R24-01]|uniref:hypothetical protein n=1 Tax=Sphingomonas sp. CARO-RG-8B-R24-01 TaxID=2914831 RepID=UPI001F586C61|nr:hypothetical protein [Sphingomonas sp. CARO-RG-8B-R24-01]